MKYGALYVKNCCSFEMFLHLLPEVVYYLKRMNAIVLTVKYKMASKGCVWSSHQEKIPL
jgi:hypothetical protein